MGITFGDLFKEVYRHNKCLETIRICLIGILIFSIISGVCSFAVCIKVFAPEQAQEYINPYNGQPVPEFTIIDGELPD